MARGRIAWTGGPRPPHAGRLLATLAPDGLPAAREGVHLLLRRVFGTAAAPRPDWMDTPSPDPGLTGPDSASWRLIGEMAAIAGGIRALLLQTMHPLAMAGVADHSRYADDPLGRLQRTAMYVTTTTFGTTAAALEVSQAVRRTHERVRGIAPDGRPYDAADPRLLTWVSATLTSSLLAADRLWAPRPLDDADADRFVDEQSRLAALLDPRVDLAPLQADSDAGAALRAGEVDLPLLADLPRSVDDLVAVLDGFEPELVVGEQARAAWEFLRRPPLSRPLQIGYLSLFVGAAGSLDRRLRRRLGLPTGRVLAAAGVAHTATVLGLLRATGGRSPAHRAASRRVARPVR